MSTEPDIPTAKIYRETYFFGVAFLGGPIAGGYIIAENYKAFGEPEKARVTWLCSAVVTIILLAVGLILPEGMLLLRCAVPLAYSAAGATLMHQLQKQKIMAYLDSGGRVYDWKWAIAVGFFGLGVMTVIVVASSFLAVLCGVKL